MDLAQVNKWFNRTKKEFTPVSSRFAGQPIVYVEIGCWAGACSEWVCQNVLTHPESIGFGIDPYWQHVQRARNNMEAIKALAATRTRNAIGDRFKWIYEPSTTGLPKLVDILKGRPIDLLYIDGDHEGPGALTDFILAWPMLRAGSIVIFDDYYKGRHYQWAHVRDACAAVESAFRWYVRPFHKRRQYALEVVTKEPPPSVPDRSIAPFGDWPEPAIHDLFSARKLNLK